MCVHRCVGCYNSRRVIKIRRQLLKYSIEPSAVLFSDFEPMRVSASRASVCEVLRRSGEEQPDRDGGFRTRQRAERHASYISRCVKSFVTLDVSDSNGRLTN